MDQAAATTAATSVAAAAARLNDARARRSIVADFRGGLQLSAWCFVVGSLVAIPAAVLQLEVFYYMHTVVGQGVTREAAFYNVTRMRSRESYTVEWRQELLGSRLRDILAASVDQLSTILFLPCCYITFLGASARVCAWTLGPALPAYLSVIALYGGFSLLFVSHYASVIGNVALLLGLYGLCRSRIVPRQAAKQMFVMALGNALVMNVIPETTDSVRVLQTFVILNLFREVGRAILVSASYYLHLAVLNGDETFVGFQRDGAIAPLVLFHCFCGTSLLARIIFVNTWPALTDGRTGCTAARHSDRLPLGSKQHPRSAPRRFLCRCASPARDHDAPHRNRARRVYQALRAKQPLFSHSLEER
jgi:hypothetical protein